MAGVNGYPDLVRLPALSNAVIVAEIRGIAISANAWAIEYVNNDATRWLHCTSTTRPLLQQVLIPDVRRIEFRAVSRAM